MLTSTKHDFIVEDNTLVLAFDIEKLGQYSINPIIEIGAVVMGVYPTCTIYDEFSYSAFDISKLGTPEYPVEERCMTEFWNKPENMEILKAIDNDSFKQNYVEFERFMMIRAFLKFLEKWELKCESNGIKLWRTTNNKIYDPAFINQMIEKFFPGVLTFPYRMHNGKYGSLPETHSMQWGFLLSNPRSAKEFRNKSSGLSKGIFKYYDHIPSKVSHDHRAKNDAYTIAHELHVCFAIADGKIKERNEPLKDV